MSKITLIIALALVAPINAAKGWMSAKGVASKKYQLSHKMRNMSMKDAFKVLEHHHGVSKGFAGFLEEKITSGGVAHKKHASGKAAFRGAGHLEVQEDPSYGSGGVGAAETMLNGLISQAELSLDNEMERCIETWDNGMEMMEGLRQDIADANYESSAAKAEVIRAGSEIAVLVKRIPETEDSLKAHNDQCKADLSAIASQLGIVTMDLSVMNTIVNMSACNPVTEQEEAGLVQTSAVVCCRDKATNSTNIVIKSSSGPFAQLQSSTAHWYMNSSFHKVKHSGSHSKHGKIAFTQVEGQAAYFVDADPETPVATSYCPGEEPAEKCSIANSPHCPMIRAKFLGIQSGIRGKLEDLQDELQETKKSCWDIKMNLEGQIKQMNTDLESEQSSETAAQKTAIEQDEISRLAQEELVEEREAFKAELHHCVVYEKGGGIECETKEEAGVCATNIDAYQVEICGLKKIRDELMKVEGDNMTFISDIIDCKVSDWISAGCDVTCGKGTLHKHRQVELQPEKGAECPPLDIYEPCSMEPCPIDCQYEEWEEWSSCSASCNGGSMSRDRRIKLFGEHGGEMCTETSETISCNNMGCDRDCILNEWSEWCGCDKICGGGKQKRVRSVAVEAAGIGGKCATEEDETRMEFQDCNTLSCDTLFGVNQGHPYLECESKIDVILLLDGSEALGEEGFEYVRSFAHKFVDALDIQPEKANVAILLYSGPEASPDYDYCRGDEVPEGIDWDPLTSCKMVWLEHLTGDEEKVLKAITDMEWPRGTRMTHMALEMAKAEISNTREDTKSVVIAVTGGTPEAVNQMKRVSHQIKNMGRLFHVLANIQPGLEARFERWSTIPFVHNLVSVPSLSELPTPKVVNGIVSDICPDLQRQHCPYWPNEGRRCPRVDGDGACGTANDLAIDAAGRDFTPHVNTLEEAEHECGAICDSHNECGGFEWNGHKCKYRRVVSYDDEECAEAEKKYKGTVYCFEREDFSCTAHPYSEDGEELVAGSAV